MMGGISCGVDTYFNNLMYWRWGGGVIDWIGMIFRLSNLRSAIWNTQIHIFFVTNHPGNKMGPGEYYELIYMLR